MPGSGTSRVATTLTAIAVTAGIGVLAIATGSPLVAAIGGITGGLLGLAVVTRETPAGNAIASGLTPLLGALVVAAVGLALRNAGLGVAILGGGSLDQVVPSVLVQLGLTTGAGIGVFGTVNTVRDGVGEGAVTRLWTSVLATLAVIAVALAGILVTRREALSALPLPMVGPPSLLDPVLSTTDAVTGLFLSSAGPSMVLLTFWALVLGLVLSVGFVLARLPIVALTARSRKARVSALLDRLYAVLRMFIWLWMVPGLANVLLLSDSLRTEAFEAAPAMRSVVATLQTPDVRLGLLTLIITLSVMGLAVSLLQRVAGRVAGVLGSYVPPALGGALAVALAAAASPFVNDLHRRLPAEFQRSTDPLIEAVSPLGLALLGVAVAVFVLLVALTVVVVAGALGYVPSRSAGGAFAATGLVTGAVSLGATGGPPLAVMVVIALGLLAWEASEHGVTIRAELDTSATRVETVHHVVSLAVATLGVGVALAANEVLLGEVAGGTESLAGALGAVVASLLLLGVLRG
jgi:hypothetical protein